MRPDSLRRRPRLDNHFKRHKLTVVRWNYLWLADKRWRETLRLPGGRGEIKRDIGVAFADGVFRVAAIVSSVLG